ncbi:MULTISPECIES: hypothetical protein [Xanthomonas]|uniref:Uncharacterized protein n=1 Tax=Xanthomonas dyei TaxID=743699 RepID=A0ABZ0DBU2_9XANT|nr:hypothetical protein [Xanthomonas dyei]WOB25881.1 hypothetical protein NYR99_19680 [Xanthomonas dyei]WOB53504.1 hypothetical protein NYR95_19685 [Xanthomonas dyei]
MPSLLCDLEDLLAAWKAEAHTFDACNMPASALAVRDCHRRLTGLMAAHALVPNASSTAATSNSTTSSEAAV